MNGDISSILDGWPYEPGKISVRRISGQDGRPKIQLRLDLGILQMETEGRPDGLRPRGFPSLLEYQQSRLETYRRRHGKPEGFRVSPNDCEDLRAESVMYYHRYLAEFALEDYAAVERDTLRNLRVLDFCKCHAASEDDRQAMEQFRPYVVMMHARARALRALEEQDFPQAHDAVTGGLRAIRDFLGDAGDAAAEASAEVAVLEALLEEIEQRRPIDPLTRLEKELRQAVQDERYEEAAAIRDRLDAMRRQGKGEKAGQ